MIAELFSLRILLEILVASVICLFFLRKREKKREDPLAGISFEEQERRIAAFQSKFLDSGAPSSNLDIDNHASGLDVKSRSSYKIMVQGEPNFPEPTECIDLATFDFHSFSTNNSVIEVAKKVVNAYGVGSCGPRGFYGTIKPHLELEADLAKFLGVEASIIYSYSFATISTIIPAYSSRGDYILADNHVSLPVQEGCSLSRSNVQYYKHLDLEDMESMMKDIADKEARDKTLSRRYIITEGVFRNSGDICNLPEVVALCEKYKFRIILEDSFGFGAIGAQGRGTPEYFNMPTSKIDLYVGSLSTSLGTVGGFCAGPYKSIEHQRLAATAYVFSASLPPYMTASASKSVELLTKEAYGTRLMANAKTFREEIRAQQLPIDKVELVAALGDASPLVHIRATDAFVKLVGSKAVEEKLEAMVNLLQSKRILVVRNYHKSNEKLAYNPSLRVALKTEMKKDEVINAACAVASAVKGSL